MADARMKKSVGAAATGGWVENRVVAALIGIAAFVVMTALGAQVRIPLPFTPVPITLQTFFVHLAGATLGPGFGAVSQAAYLAVGAAGAPVFAGGKAGLAVLQGPTAGYLVGFVLATIVVGGLIRRRPAPGYGWILFCMAAGSLTVYACGVSWLAWVLNLPLPVAVAKGMLPFLLGDVLKTCAAAALFLAYRRQARAFFP